MPLEEEAERVPRSRSSFRDRPRWTRGYLSSAGSEKSDCRSELGRRLGARFAFPRGGFESREAWRRFPDEMSGYRTWGIRPPLPVRITIRIVLSLFPVCVRTAQKIGKQKEPIDSLLRRRISAGESGCSPKGAEPPWSFLLRAPRSHF